jgi:hypothetical protein
MEPDAGDVVFETIRTMVSDGEYLDHIPGLPGGPQPGPSGFFQRRGDGPLQPMYLRGSPEHLQARQAGLIVPLPALTPTMPEAVQEAEAVLGSDLPRLLCRLYLEVGNGGFGPGYGVLGLSGGHHAGGQTALDLYRQATPAPPWSLLPAGLLPLCAWGCGIYSFTDCSHPDGRIWAWDPNGGPAGREGLFDQEVKLGDWLDQWVAGKLYQPTGIQDAMTGQWRGATNAEMEAMLPPEVEDPPPVPGSWR